MKIKKAVKENRDNGRETLDARGLVYGRRIGELTEKILGIQDEYKGHRATVRVIDEKLVELTKAAEELRGKKPPAPSFDEARGDLLAAVALGERKQEELDNFDASVSEKLKKHHAETAAVGRQLVPLEQTISALKRKANFSKEQMEELAGRHRDAVVAFLQEKAEWIGEEYRYYGGQAAKAMNRIVAHESLLHKIIGKRAFLSVQFQDFAVPQLGLKSTTPEVKTFGDINYLYSWKHGIADNATKDEANLLTQLGIQLDFGEEK
jgi:chromosome segregation ATPase